MERTRKTKQNVILLRIGLNRGTSTMKVSYCSLVVALERTVFPFVKHYIEDKMAAECSHHQTFRAHFLKGGKGQYDSFSLNNYPIDT